jgi:DNA-binding winged helix-turn-helix (wHTH) protein/tetratricopeptide (TPR) repeat protein/TolB-like protein
MSRQMRHYYKFGPFRLDPAKRDLLRDGEIVPLPPKVLDLLQVLVENNGEIVEKEELMSRVWPDSFVEEGNLSVNIFALRKALGDDGNQHQFIKTVPKRGYRFVASVLEVWGENEELTSESLEAAAAAMLQGDDFQSKPQPYLPLPSRASFGQAASRADDLQTFAGREETPEPPSMETAKRRVVPRAVRRALAFSLLGVGLVVGLTYFWTSRDTARTIAARKTHAIAVLPFKTINTDDEYLGPGLADVFIGELTNIKQLTVRPLTASLKYISNGQDPVEAGRALRVDTVLEGSLRRVGDSLRITAQLVRVEDGSRLWEFKSSEEFGNISAVQQVIPGKVAQALALDLKRPLSANQRTGNVEAHLLYVKGRYLMSQRTPMAFKQAVECFGQATRLDPNYALAYAGLAYSWMVPIYPETPIKRMAEAKSAAIKALELDDTVAEAHTALGRALTFCDWDWAGSEKEFKRAIELNPNYAEAHFWYSLNLSAMRRHDEAIAEMKWAQEIDPFSPKYNFHLGWAYYLARQYDQAIAQLRKTPFELDSSYYQAYWRLGLAYVQKAMYEDAFDALEKAAVLSGDKPLIKATIGYAYAKSGNRAEAQRIVNQLSLLSERETGPFITLASIHASLGNKDKAFELLEKSYQQRDSRIVDINVDAMLDSVRPDARFDDLMRRMGLTP